MNPNRTRARRSPRAVTGSLSCEVVSVVGGTAGPVARRFIEVPVRFAVSDAEARQMFGGIGRTAWFAIRRRHGLKRLPGGVTSVLAIDRALRAAEGNDQAQARPKNLTP